MKKTHELSESNKHYCPKELNYKLQMRATQVFLNLLVAPLKT